MAVASPTLDEGGRSILERSSSARRADPLFRAVLTAMAGLILVLIVFFFVFLIDQAEPALSHQGVFSFLFSNDWNPSREIYGAWPLVAGTLITSAIALVIGVPVAVAAALYIVRAGAAPRARPAHRPHRAARRRPVRRLRPVGRLRARADAQAGRAVVQRHLLVPAVRRRHGRRPQLLHGGPDPRDHDPADRRRDLARGHRDRAAGAQGGVARARRHALGDDPAGGPAVLARRHHGRRDARPRPRDRRDDRRDARDRQRADDRRLDLRPGLHARRGDRQRVRRGGERPAALGGADRRRPRALRPHAARERRARAPPVRADGGRRHERPRGRVARAAARRTA